MMAEKLTTWQSNSTNVRNNYLKKSLTWIAMYGFWLLNPLLVRRFIHKNFFAPRKYKLSEQELQLLETAQEFNLNVNEQNVRCWQWGNGPAVIFVHGWNGSGLQFHPFFAKFTQAGCSIITFDGPGHGQSEGTTSSYFEMTNAVRAVLKHFAAKPVLGIIGHSFGAAAIVNALAKENQNLPTVLIAPALEIKEMLDQSFGIHGVPQVIFQRLIHEYQDRFGYDLVRDNPQNLLSEFTLKALIIHDREDKITPYAVSQQAAKNYAAVELVTTNGLGHKKILNDEQVINRALRFLHND